MVNARLRIPTMVIRLLVLGAVVAVSRLVPGRDIAWGRLV